MENKNLISCIKFFEKFQLIRTDRLNCSGFPVWLRDIPGIVFRTDNAPFKVQSTQVLVHFNICLYLVLLQCLLIFYLINYIAVSRVSKTIFNHKMQKRTKC